MSLFYRALAHLVSPPIDQTSLPLLSFAQVREAIETHNNWESWMAATEMLHPAGFLWIASPTPRSLCISIASPLVERVFGIPGQQEQAQD